MNLVAVNRRVIKLGGSLLELPGWPDRFRAWRASQPPAVDVLIIGGGRAADAVRAWDRLHALGDDAAHWLAIDAMTLTARLAATLLPEAATCGRIDELAAAEPGQLWLFDVAPELHAADFEPDGLPHSWDVTSDSIAAWLALRIKADECVLLKIKLGDSRRRLR